MDSLPYFAYSDLVAPRNSPIPNAPLAFSAVELQPLSASITPSHAAASQPLALASFCTYAFSASKLTAPLAFTAAPAADGAGAFRPVAAGPAAAASAGVALEPPDPPGVSLFFSSGLPFATPAIELPLIPATIAMAPTRILAKPSGSMAAGLYLPLRR